MTSPADRRFNDQQVALVLRTAAELQEKDGGATGGARGMSLAQLEQIAAEAGIDPSMVRRAVARMDDVGDGKRPSPFAGASSRIVVERLVDGEAPASAFESILAAARRVSGQLGDATTVGGLFGWKGTLEGLACELSVEASGGSTRVRVSIDASEALVGYFMLKVVLGGVMGSIGTGLAAASLLGGAFGPLGMITMGAGYAWWRRGNTKMERTLRLRCAELADAAVAAVERELARPPHDRLLASAGE